MEKPILGITMGDPFGNGPEVTVRALSDKAIYSRCRPLVVGDASSMAYALKVAKKVSGISLALHPVKDGVLEVHHPSVHYPPFSTNRRRASHIPGLRAIS